MLKKIDYRVMDSAGFSELASPKILRFPENGKHTTNAQRLPAGRFFYYPPAD